jgi:hypothetical protein
VSLHHYKSVRLVVDGVPFESSLDDVSIAAAEPAKPGSIGRVETYRGEVVLTPEEGASFFEAFNKAAERGRFAAMSTYWEACRKVPFTDLDPDLQIALCGWRVQVRDELVAQFRGFRGPNSARHRRHLRRARTLLDRFPADHFVSFTDHVLATAAVAATLKG